MGKKEKEVVDVRDTIVNHLEQIERNLSWLATKTGYNYNTLYSIFVQKTVQLSDEKLNTINSVLKTKFKK